MEFFTPELALCKLSDTVFTVQCPGNFSQFESVVINKEAIYRIAGEPFNAPINGMPHLEYLGQMLEKGGGLPSESSLRELALQGVVISSSEVTLTPWSAPQKGFDCLIHFDPCRKHFYTRHISDYPYVSSFVVLNVFEK